MPGSRFDNMVHGHSAAEQQSMRKQVDEAEAKGLRTYQVTHAKGFTACDRKRDDQVTTFLCQACPNKHSPSISGGAGDRDVLYTALVSIEY